MMNHRHGAVLAAVLGVLVVGMTTGSFATSWQVEPFISTPEAEYYAAWSPDGQQVAYVSDATGLRQVYIVNADGTGTWQVTDDPNAVMDVAWSPDSQCLVYTQTWSYPHDVIKVELNETRDGVVATTNLTNETATASWRDARFSPDGSMIVARRAYSSQYYVYLVYPDGSGVQRLTNTYAFAPAYTPDGSMIGYSLSGSMTGISDIWTIMSEGGGKIELVDRNVTNQHIRSLAWSPDEAKLVYSAPNLLDSVLGIVNADGTGAVTLDAGPAKFPLQFYPQMEDIWSADSTRIVYSCKEGTVWNVYTINADGTGKELVAATGGDCVRARFFGNGNICFETDVNGNWDIYIATSNLPPEAAANGPYIVPATSWDGALVELDGSASTDPNGDPLTFTWKIGEEVIGTEPIIMYQFPIGQTDVTLEVMDPSGATSTAETTVTVTVAEVEVDIRPFTDLNWIVLGRRGLLPVAFLTDETFDAATIDPLTITVAGYDFGGVIKIIGWRNPRPAAWLWDVDGDGDQDLFVLLKVQNLAIEATDTLIVLGALTYEGNVVQGEDSIIVLPLPW